MEWNKQQQEYTKRLNQIKPFLLQGKIAQSADIVALLEAVIKPGDTVCLEGDNQKQADFLLAVCVLLIHKKFMACIWCSQRLRCRNIWIFLLKVLQSVLIFPLLVRRLHA